MRAKERQSGLNIKMILLTAAIVVIAVVIVVFTMQWRRGREEQKRIGKGIDYLKSLEEQDVTEITDQIKTVRSELNLDAADADAAEIWSKFQEAVVLGDSRAVGFSYYECLPPERVLAENGATIKNVSDYVEQLKSLNPKQIFLCYGLNDVKSKLWPTADDYNAAYEEQIKMIGKEFPNSTVYINSILPAIGEGLNETPEYQRIGEYNEGLKTFCEEKGYHFIDNTEIASQHEDMYQKDGLHVSAEFYKYWAANMLTEVEE